VLTDLGGDDSVFAVAVQKDGKIVAVGDSTFAALVRYTAGGRLDSSFGTGGTVSRRKTRCLRRWATDRSHQRRPAAAFDAGRTQRGSMSIPVSLQPGTI
jgi:beta-propeller uncharacterized protein DUF5122